MNQPIIGSLWHSQTLTRTFLVLSGPECLCGLGKWKNKTFVGHRAAMLLRSSGALALVGLTERPNGYPYDWVLI
jgi:hypothetical protein